MSHELRCIELLRVLPFVQNIPKLRYSNLCIFKIRNVWNMYSRSLSKLSNSRHSWLCFCIELKARTREQTITLLITLYWSPVCVPTHFLSVWPLCLLRAYFGLLFSLSLLPLTYLFYFLLYVIRVIVCGLIDCDFDRRAKIIDIWRIAVMAEPSSRNRCSGFRWKEPISW
jgi:hypothetical protein